MLIARIEKHLLVTKENLGQSPIPATALFAEMSDLFRSLRPGRWIGEKDDAARDLFFNQITLETDKAAMDVPSTATGTVDAVLVKVGDKVSEGTPGQMTSGESNLFSITNDCLPN